MAKPSSSEAEFTLEDFKEQMQMPFKPDGLDMKNSPCR